MEYKDYYAIMGLKRDASPEDIKRAYRKLARKYHPDVSKEPQAEVRFKEIGEACEVLKDPQKRAAYDQLGQRWRAGQDFTPPPEWGRSAHTRASDFTEPTDFSEFFSFLFGEDRPYRTQRRRAHGKDIHRKLQVSLEDAYQGAVRTIQLPSTVQGQQMRTLRVKIPKGITQGQQIRLTGQGEPGVGGGKAGDLYLEIEFQAHPWFQVEGADIYLTLPITPWEAALGATVAVPTLGGKVDVKIPAGAQSGQKLRLKGRGLPSQQPGDQYVILQMVTPKADRPEIKELYERMAREMAYHPRAKWDS